MSGVCSVEVLRAGRCAGWDEHAEYTSPTGNATLRRLSITEIGMGATVWGYWDVIGSDDEPMLDRDSLPLSIGDIACYQPWSHGGDRFAVPILARWPDGAWRYEVAIMDVRKREVVQQFDNLFAPALIWAPDDDDVLAVTNEGPVLLNSRSGQRRSASVPGFDRARQVCAAWLPSGKGFGCSVRRSGSQRLAVLDRRTLSQIGESPLDPSDIVAFDGEREVREIKSREIIFWHCENYAEGGFGLGTTARDALKSVFGEWANVAVEPNSSTLLLSVYRPILDSNGHLTMSLPSNGYRTCLIEEVCLRLSLSE